jgi:HAMP domain-containing protein
MLRRKLILILAPLVVLMLGVAVTAVLVLQNLLTDLRHVQTQALATVDHVGEVGNEIAMIQTELYRLQLGSERHLDKLLDCAETLQAAAAELGQHYCVAEEPCAGIYRNLQTRLPVFCKSVSAMATSQDPALTRKYNDSALQSAVTMNQDILEIGRFVRAHAEVEQRDLVTHFRRLVLGMAVAFLLLINTSILLLLRAANMVLRPVSHLVQASRALGQEQFDHRVALPQGDEFGELAHAYNSLAEQLQANEQRKLEMMGQVALTLNHELNNAMAIIELQLELLHRKARSDQGHEKYLRQIRECLERMTGTIASLKRVRRIVLTDYIEGVKMLDLQKSVEEEPSSPSASPVSGDLSEDIQGQGASKE